LRRNDPVSRRDIGAHYGKVEPHAGHATIVDSGGGYEITVPAKKNILVVLFLGLWMIGWTVGLVSAGNSLLAGTRSNQPSLFLLAWSGLWIVGGGFAFVTLLWMLIGREIIRVSTTELQHVRHYGLFSRKREYEMAHIKHLRVSPQQQSGSSYGGRYYTSQGTMAFDYGMSTPSFGYELDEAEARAIVDLLSKRFRNLA
jgi:hypothetical protein